MYQKADNISKIILNAALTFFVAYSVLQSTAISLKLSNNVIIAVLFVLLVFEIIIQMNINHIRLFSRERENSILKFIRPLDYIVFLFLLVNTIWIFWVPRLNGFAVSDAIREAGMLALFVLYFPLAILIRMNKINVKFFINVFYWSIFALACWHIIMWIWLSKDSNAFNIYFALMDKIPIVRVGKIVAGWGIVRVPVSNSTILCVGLLMTFAVSQRLSIKQILCSTVFTFAILATFYRSVWVGALSGLFILFIYFCIALVKGKRAECRNAIIIVLTIFLTCVVLDSTVFQDAISNRMSNAFVHSTSSDISDNSDSDIDSFSIFNKKKDYEGAISSNNDKLAQSKALIQAWLKKPLTGYGFGSYVPTYLKSTNKYVYEMTTFSLLLKIGIVGIACWLFLAIYTIIQLIKYEADKKLLSVWLAAAIAFCISIQTNPLLFTANSIAFFMYLILYTVHCENCRSEDVLT